MIMDLDEIFTGVGHGPRRKCLDFGVILILITIHRT